MNRQRIRDDPGTVLAAIGIALCWWVVGAVKRFAREGPSRHPFGAKPSDTLTRGRTS